MLPLFLPALCHVQAEPAWEKAVRAVLAAQEAAWNRGDLEGYLRGYWDSPDLRFIGSRGLIFGIESLRTHYRRGRPEGSDFGHLTFLDVRVERLGEAVLATGSYRLEGPKPGEGRFSLVLKEIPGQGWRIVYDHSS